MRPGQAEPATGKDMSRGLSLGPVRNGQVSSLPCTGPAVAGRRQALRAFEDRWKKLEVSGWPIPRQVDYRLLGSALARVRWELDITRGWRRNPMFYLDQTLGAIFERLLRPPPIDRARSEEIVSRMAGIPRTVEAAKLNLDQAVAPFAGREDSSRCWSAADRASGPAGLGSCGAWRGSPVRSPG